MRAGELYTGEKTLKTRFREAVIYRLGTIKKRDGYFRDVNDVLDQLPTSMSEFKGLDALVFVRDESVAKFMDNSMYTENVPFLIQAFLKDNTREAQEQIEADVVKLFADMPQVLDQAGNPTCFLTEFTGSMPTDRFRDKNQCGLLMKFTSQLLYQQQDATQT